MKVIRRPDMDIIMGKRMKRLGVMICSLAIVCLTACFPGPPPEFYTDPLTDLWRSGSQDNVGQIRLGIIPGQSYQSAMASLVEEAESLAKLGNNVVELNPHYITIGLNRILTSYFKDVSVVQSLEEARQRELDMVMTLDLIVILRKYSHKKNEMHISGEFLDVESGRSIDLISGKGFVVIPSPYFASFNQARNMALSQFADGLVKSGAIATAAEKKSAPEAEMLHAR